MKAPVGLLSDRTVLRSKMEELCPDKFQFAVLGSSRFWGRRSPTRALSKSNKCPNADPRTATTKGRVSSWRWYPAFGAISACSFMEECGILCLCEMNVFYKSEFVERFLELSLFYGLSSPLNSEMICIFPYF